MVSVDDHFFFPAGNTKSLRNSRETLYESMNERRQIVTHAACDRLVRVHSESVEVSEDSEG